MTHTRGNVIVEEIKIGDIHYEYDMGLGIRCEVLTKPELDENGTWVWKSKNTKTAKEIDYAVNPEYTQYSPNLYDYEAYSVNVYI